MIFLYFTICSIVFIMFLLQHNKIFKYVLYKINIIQKNGITFYDMSKDNIAIMKTNNCSQ